MFSKGGSVCKECGCAACGEECVACGKDCYTSVVCVSFQLIVVTPKGSMHADR